jgi:hypothetical protein
MDPVLKHILEHNMLIPLVAITFGSTIAIVAIVSTAIRAMVVGKAREQTKRELAAYVAEGSLDPEKAVAMINAGRPHWEVGHAGTAKHKGGCCT